MTAARAQTFFLPGLGPIGASAGARYCVFHPPVGACRGAVLYVPPFAEEMNRTRRMAAMQARALAAQGIGVLQIDLHGSGDSSGDFGDARWDGWLRDLASATDWLQARLQRPVSIWGLRLGALLALDFARHQFARTTQRPARLVLWQPVLNGAAHLTQFLRLRMAADMLGDAAGTAQNTESMRAELRNGGALEVAGYRLDGALAGAIDALDGASLMPPVPVHWFEIVATPERPLTPAGVRVAERWRADGATVHAQTVTGPAFWASAEITECQALIDATCAVFTEVTHAA